MQSCRAIPSSPQTGRFLSAFPGDRPGPATDLLATDVSELDTSSDSFIFYDVLRLQNRMLANTQQVIKEDYKILGSTSCRWKVNILEHKQLIQITRQLITSQISS
jgi:hypothetical protein